MVKVNEILNAQTIDVGIISGTLHGKVLTEIHPIGANLLSKFRKGDVVLQIELRLLAMLLEQVADVLGHAKRRSRVVAHG